MTRPSRLDQVSEEGSHRLSHAAWSVRDNAFLMGNTAVGCAVLGEDGRIYQGCNVEHRYRCHDVHAEVNAISSMVAGGCRKLLGVLVASERTRFTPCGGCLDWIFQFGGSETWVGYQTSPEGEVCWHMASELMPYYPE